MLTPGAEQAFMSSILAHYGEDGPRLIFADYLDESDDPADRGRGELIRIQCALARITQDHPRREELTQRQEFLLEQFKSSWTEHLRGLAEDFEFRRGVLDSVSVNTTTFLAKGDELFRRAPVRRIRLIDAGRRIARVAHCPFLASVRELVLCGNDLGNGGTNMLLRSQYLGHLESLDLSFNGLCDGGARVVARSRATPRLRSLLLTDNGQISGKGVEALATSPHLSGLRVLDVSGNDVNDAGVRAVVESRYLTNLHTLRLSGNHIGDAGAENLAGSALLTRMLKRCPRLELQSNAIGPAGILALAASPLLGEAASLDLSGNYLGDEGVRSLAASSHLTGLRRLGLRQNHIGDIGATALARSPLMGRLAFLDVSSNRITRKGVDALWANRRSFQTVLKTAGNLAGNALVPSEPAPLELSEPIGQILRRIGSDSSP